MVTQDIPSRRLAVPEHYRQRGWLASKMYTKG